MMKPSHSGITPIIERSRVIDLNSKENIFTKMETNTIGGSEPIVINNTTELADDSGSEDSSRIQLTGDSGIGDFYPSPYLSG